MVKKDSINKRDNLNPLGETKRFRIPVWLYIASLALVVGMLVWNMEGIIAPTRSAFWANTPSDAGIFIVLLLAVINLIATRVRGKTIFSRWHLPMIYGSLYTALWVSSATAIPYVIFSAIKFQTNKMFDANPMAEPIFARMSPLMFPKSEDAVWGFWLGQSEVPWGEWIWPIVMWSILVLSILFIWYFAAILVQKQWTEREHFRYLIAEATLTILDFRKKGDDESPGFWTQRSAQLGLVIGLCLGLPYILNKFWPGVPVFIPGEGEIRLYEYLPAGTPWRNVSVMYPGRLHAYLKPYGSWYVLGFGYLAPLNLSFSIWFFYLLNYAVNVANHASGAGALEITSYGLNAQTRYMGALMGMGFVSLYFARADIGRVIKKAFLAGGNAASIDDSEEPIGYRVAVFGFLISAACFVVIAVKFLMADIAFAVWWVVAAIGAIVGFARIRVEAGLPARCPHSSWRSPVEAFFGKAALGTGNAFFSGAMAPLDPMELPTLPILFQEQYYMADKLKVNKRHVTKFLWIGVIISLVLGFLLALPILYSRGGFDAHSFYPTFYGDIDTAASMPLAEPLNYWSAMHFFIGLIGTALLARLQVTFVWWPFHPLGFVLAPNYMGMVYWFPMLIVWVVKTIINRYGGYALYKRTLPFVYGFIAADVLIRVTETLIDIIRSVVR